MKILHTRRTAVVLAGAIAAGTLAWSSGTATVSAATVNFNCKGVEGDVAGSVSGANKSSKQLLELLATLGGSAELSLPVDVAVSAPASVKTGSGPFDAKFAYNITLPESLVTSAKDLLKVNAFKVTNASFAVNVSGAATGSIVGTTASVNVPLSPSPVVVKQQVAGSVTPDKSGLVYYRPGASKFSVVVNGEVAGVAKVGTLSVNCTSTGLLGSTAVKPAGSPNITKNPFVVQAPAGEKTSVNLDADSLITPDESNPIVWDSLKVVGAPKAGSAAFNARVLEFTAPAANGTYDVTYEVCGASRTVQGDPGTDEVQTFKFSDPRYANGYDLNKKPLAFTLKFDGQETAPIITSFIGEGIFEKPYNPKDKNDALAHGILGVFRAPKPAAIQAALEALPNVGVGDVIVSGGPTPTVGAVKGNLMNPYTFTFAGALAKKDTAQITVGQFMTWLPADVLTAILNAATAINAGGGGPAVAPPTIEQSVQAFLDKQISFDKMLAQIGDRVKFDLLANLDIQAILDAVLAVFPKAPLVATTTTGEPKILDSDSGPLCTQGVVQFVVTGGTAPETEVEGSVVTQAPGAEVISGNATFTG